MLVSINDYESNTLRDGILLYGKFSTSYNDIIISFEAYDVETWEEVGQLRTPGLRNHGVAGGGNARLWVADTSAGAISLLDTKDGRVYDVLRVEAPDEVHGMTIHEDVIWYCDATSCDIGRLIRNE